ncbi:glucokinase, partial [Halomonas sp.]|uniref:glucokinase n=1 Tax=Halomonas sp. TaxID=1486246 RepID=UPI00356A3AAE
MTRPALIGDIGGTNARFALVTPGAFEPHDILSLPCADYPGLLEAVQDYLSRVGLSRVGLSRAGQESDDIPREACLAVACPIRGDRVTMTNNHWSFSRNEICDALGLSLFKVINDFTAQA